jgi:hypothetical protein
MTELRLIRDPSASLCGANEEEFLRNLGGPACIELTGDDPTRRRAFVTLLHGNEPSGLLALRHWLLSGQRPAVNVTAIVASVHAALAEPSFTQRMLPRARDLNRCFRPPFDGEQGRLAAAILDYLRERRPEAVVDMHNTSGSGPSFAVVNHADAQHEALASLFTRRLIMSQLHLGALMEQSVPHCPVVTIEVGGRQDEEAHALAVEGLERYFLAKLPQVDGAAHDWGLELLQHPIRIELRDGVALGYGEDPLPGYDVTLRADIEHYNFGTVDENTCLGWMATEPRALFSAQDAQGRCALGTLLHSRDGRLYPARPLKLFMITTNATIAQSDCLSYAVADDGSPLRSVA